MITGTKSEVRGQELQLGIASTGAHVLGWSSAAFLIAGEGGPIRNSAFVLELLF